MSPRLKSPLHIARSAGKVSSKLFIFIIPLIVVVFAATVIIGRGGNKFGGIEAFPLQTYLHSADTIRGNSYLIQGQVEGRLGYEEGKGAILALKLIDGTSGRVPVFVPDELSHNIENGQRFNLKVIVRRDLVVAQSLEKL